MNYSNGQVRQFEAGICGGNPLVVPVSYLFQINICEDIGGKLELAAADSRQIEDDRSSTGDDRDVQHGAALGLGLLFGIHDAVRSAEIDGLFTQLANTAARADRLIVDFD